MNLNLSKDLVFFDLETTGVSVSSDRIVQIGMIKYYSDGRKPEEKNRLVNPTVTIPEEASAIHGITNDMVQDAPTFKQISKGIESFIGDADLCGFNSNRFDVPLLIEEFYRAGSEFDMNDRRSIDVWKIFQKMEPRNLKAAYKFYCNKDLEGAHDAMNDIRATAAILESQLDYYKDSNYEESDGTVEERPIVNDMSKLHDFTNFKGQLDYSGRIVLNENNVAVFNFGKYQDQSVVDVLKHNPGYYAWFMKSDFSTDTKKVLEKIMEKSRTTQNEPKLQ